MVADADAGYTFEKLRDRFGGVRELPWLVILDRYGRVTSTDGIADVSKLSKA